MQYMVTAQDGSTLDYLVTVSVKTDDSKAIIRFALELPSGLFAEGIIDETEAAGTITGTITVNVPAGTDTRSLDARIAHTGDKLLDPNTGEHPSGTFSFHGDFSSPTDWTVIALDDTEMRYTVTVVIRKSSDKEITDFRLNVSGESVIIGSEPQPDGKYPILAVLPDSVSLAGVIPYIKYVGSDISPEENTEENFGDLTNPVTYTVTAEDRSVREYVVKVVLKETAGNSEKQITGFYVTNPLIEGVIDESQGTIALTVPTGTDLRFQQPEIYYRGVSISPLSGQPVDFSGADSNPVNYTVRARDNSSRTYKVWVFFVPAPTPPVVTVPDSKDEKVDIGAGTDGSGDYTVIVEFPVYIENPVITINYPGAGNTVNIGSIDASKNVNLDSNIYLENNYLQVNNNNVFNYVPIQLDNGEYTYVLVVNPPPEDTIPDSTPDDPDSAKATIDGFYFANPAAVGTINQSAGTIDVTVPYGTNLSSLTPTICYTGKEIVGISGPSPVTGPATSFDTKVSYKVKARDGTTEKTYQVTVTKASEDPLYAKATIDGFYFANPAAVGIIGKTDGSEGAGTAGDPYRISVTVPHDTNLGSLAPTICYTGKEIVGISGGSPLTDSARSFAAAVDYTVKAYDGVTTKTYRVNVTVASADPLYAIATIDGFYFANPAAVGTINQSARTIDVTVPYGTNRSNLAPVIFYTGKEIEGISGVSPVTGQQTSFATTVDYTVKAQDGTTTKTYQVRVTVAPANPNSTIATIDGFYFATPAAVGIIGKIDGSEGAGTAGDPYRISVTVPHDTNLSSLAPTICYTGKEIVGISGGSPLTDSGKDFTGSVSYTVKSRNGTIEKTYQVTVTKAPADSLYTEASIDGFYFANPAAVGIIGKTDGSEGDGTAGDPYRISVTVPHDTNLSSLAPTICYTGKEIVGISGGSPLMDSAKSFATAVDYTVKALDDTTTKTYRVNVTLVPADPLYAKATIDGFYFANPAAVGIIGKTDGSAGMGTAGDPYSILVTVPYGTNLRGLAPVISYTGREIVGIPGASPLTGQPSSFAAAVDYTVKARDDTTTKTYRVNVSVASEDPLYTKASIDGFYFANPVAVGEIDQSAGTITVKVPYGTDLRNLTATLCYTGKEIVGIPGANPLKDGARSFTGVVEYTVKAHDTDIMKTYRVTVVTAPNTAKDITAFAFSGVNPTTTSIGAIPNADGNYPIQITVPDGASIDSLTPVITHTGASIAGPGFASDGGPGTPPATPVTSFSATSPVNYTVTAKDGSTKTYAVTVRHAGGDDDTIEITGFYFTAPLAAGTINQAANTITVIVPAKTDTASLVPTVYFKGMSVSPGSGAANNFNGPVVYTVTGINGKTRPYTVTVQKTPSSAKDITRFAFPGLTGAETVIGAVPDPDGSYPIAVWVPAGTVLDNRAPDLAHTGLTISPTIGTALSFNVPQTYTVTAEDGSTKTYKVTATPLSGDTKLITSLVFNAVPLQGGGSIRAIAAIDQDSHTITVEVPAAANISGLTPTITYIGRSIVPPGGSDQTANPFTDPAARNFSSDQTYTVKDQSGGAQPYTVRVQKQSTVMVHFDGETDLLVAESVFDPVSGVITVRAAAAVAAPYGWYIDGVKQAVPNTQNTFTLNVGDGTFVAGRHEILVSGRKDDLHYTGKVYFTVSGGTK
jgi:hypothetical protein